MNRTLTPQERAACEAFIAERGITKLPTGASTQPQYIWDDATKQLVQIEGQAIGWRDRKKTRNRAKPDLSKTRRVIDMEARRAKALPMFQQGMSAVEVGAILGVTDRTAKADKKALRDEGKL